MKSIAAFVRRISSTLKSTLSLGLEEPTLPEQTCLCSEETDPACCAVGHAQAAAQHLKRPESLRSRIRKHYFGM